MGIIDRLGNLFGGATPKLAAQPQDMKMAFDMLKVGIRGRPQYPDTDIASLIGAYRRNELTYACIEKISESALDPELIVERRNAKDEWEIVPDHPLRRLMKRPNPLDDEGSFLGAWLASEHISGKFAAEIVRNSLGLPVQLWPLDPSKIVPIAGDGKDGNPIAAFEYRDGGHRITLPGKNVLYRHNRDLTNPFNGLSPLAVALGAVDADTAQTDYVRAFFNNDGTPSGMLTTDQRLNQPDADALEQRWMMKFGRGGSKHKGVAVAGQGVTYNRIGSNLDELSADEVRGHAESRICMVFGVPPLLVGAYVGLLHVNQRASAREAQSDFWTNKMSPLFKRLRTYLTWRLLTEFEGEDLVAGDRVRVSWDMTNVVALQEDQDTRHTRARENVKAGIWTLNEGRETTGQEPDPDGNYYLRPLAVSPIDPSQALAVEKVPQGKELKQSTDGKNIGLLFRLKGNKAFDYEGLQLSREPNEREKLAVKAIAGAQEASKKRVAALLLEARYQMVDACVEGLQKFDPANYHTITVGVSEKMTTRLAGYLKGIYSVGRTQVRGELATQSKSATYDIYLMKADDLEDELDDLAAATLSRVANDVQARAISKALSLAVLGLAANEFRKRLREALDELSTAPQEQAAGMAANRALGLGRAAEMDARKDEIERYQYSAILDRNTCEGCGGEDAKEASDPDELQSAPNPECEGGDLCRCFIVAIAQ
jgi:HK97 family phage portal protein